MFKLKTKDFIKGLLVSVLTSVLVVIQGSIESGSLTFNWTVIGMAAVGSAIAYLLKNFLTDDVKEAKKVIEDAKFTKAAAPNDEEINNK